MNFESSQANLPSFIQVTCGCQLESMIWTDRASLFGCCWPKPQTPFCLVSSCPASYLAPFWGVCDLALPPANPELFAQ